MRLRDLKISRRLVVAFSSVSLLVILLGILSVFYSHAVGDLVEDLYNHPFTVSNAVLRIKVNIFDIHREMKDLALAETMEELERHKAEVDRIERATLREFDLIEERFLGEMEIVLTARETFDDWAAIRLKVITLSRNGRYKEASEITKGEGAMHVEKLEQNIQSLIDFASGKALEFRNAAEAKVEQTFFTLLILLVLVLIVCVAAGTLITLSITTPLGKILTGIRRIETGDLSFEIPVDQRDEIGILADSFRAMQKNLLYKSDIAETIARGNLSRQVQPRSDKDNLAQAINQIVRNFSIVVKQANAVAAGDFRTDVIPHSDQDELGHALFRMKENLKGVVDVAARVAESDFSLSITPKSDRDELSIRLNDMTAKLKQLSEARKEQAWLKTGQAELSNVLQGEKSTEEIGRDIIRFVTTYLGCEVGCIYLRREEGYELIGSHAFLPDKETPVHWNIGEGLVGQAAVEQRLLLWEKLPENYMTVASGTGRAAPRNLILLPCAMNHTTRAVLEIASLTSFNEVQQDFLRSVADNIAIALASTEAREQTITLLQQTQAQSDAMRQQQQELQKANEELEIQARKLQASEEELRSQQDELIEVNVKLEERTHVLEDQKEIISQKNRELERTSQYKSEFLANMSHELRTPLNSLLILAQDMKENREKNLKKSQLQSADIIYKSGHDLLQLINEILDLSKIESGKMDTTLEDVELPILRESVISNFRRLAEEKGLALTTQTEAGTPESIRTDRQKLDRIVKNLVSNAIKFTEKGSVSCVMSPAVRKNRPALKIAVTDTGIGIPPEMQAAVFEAFQQADGGISRKYNGTGLGLSIVKELTRLLGGEVRLQSLPDQGSTFEVILPIGPLPPEELLEEGEAAAPGGGTPQEGGESPPGDQRRLSQGSPFKGKKILLADDDMRNVFALAKILEENQMQILKAANGQRALETLESHPDIDLILMDVTMPEMDGLETARKIRQDERFKNLPLIAVTAKAMTKDREKCIEAGMNDYLSKPINIERLLTLMRLWLYQ